MKLQRRLCLVFTIYAIFCTDLITARRHHLEVRNDVRPYIALSTFGFFTDGRLSVELSNMKIDNESAQDLFGLTLDKTTIDQMNPYLDAHQNKCLLEEPSDIQRNGQILFFIFDLINLRVKVQCSPDWHNQHIYKDKETYYMYRNRGQFKPKVSDSSLFVNRRRRDIAPIEENESAPVTPPVDPAGLSEEEPYNVSKDLPLVTAVVKNTLNKNMEVKANVAKNEEEEKIEKSKDNLNATVPEKEITPKEKIENVPEIDIKPKKELPKETEIAAFPDVDVKVASAPQTKNNPLNNQLCHNFELPLGKKIVNGQAVYNMSFYMLVESLHDEGQYNLYFHACPNYRTQKAVSFVVDIEEKNHGNFLSAGEMPLPALYFMMSILFFLSGLFWVFLLKKSKYNVSKIHYIMAVLVFLKSLSLMFHAINFHFIEIRGEHVEAWAILYYITHLFKGAVLFITIVLIGTGWTFIKHILSDKDKKIFMIVIPLQVLANVAEIIIDESEESDIEFRTWRNIFIFVDLICCGAILFPIVWSIRHLHEASATDGKAAINLRKLKLFRQFYIMIVCYIYFTRIIVYLLKMTVAFQYAWVDEMFHELATYVFFVLTGYKFRPESSHPYFTVADDDDDDDEVEVLTESGLTEGLHRTKAQNRNALLTKTKVIEGNDEEREILMIKRESSHEYD